MYEIETTIGNYLIEVRDPHYPSLVFFKKAKGSKDNEGVYAFWSVIGKNGNRLVTARARVGLHAGERFERINVDIFRAGSLEDRRAYAQFFYDVMDSGKNVGWIRPSSNEEVAKWAKSHEEDFKYAVNIYIGGKFMDVKKFWALATK